MSQRRGMILQAIRYIFQEEMAESGASAEQVAEHSIGHLTVDEVEDILNGDGEITQITVSAFCDACCTGMNQRAYLLRLLGMVR